MSDHYSAESADSTSDSNAPDSQLPGSANKMNIASESSLGIGPESLFTPTSPSLNERMSSRSMSYAEDSHAKTSALRARARESTGQGRVFGPSTRGLLASFDPDTSSWRTSQLSLETNGLDGFSETWPRSGMTRSGTAYQLQPLVPRIKETASGLLPTPTAKDPSFTNLEVVDRDGNPPEHHNQRWYSRESGRVVQKGVGQAVTLLLPTPRSGGRGLDGGSRARQKGRDLGIEWISHRRLNPCFLEWMMGFPPLWSVTDPGPLLPSGTPSSPKSRSGSDGAS